jgi:hypothetical protein
MSTTVLDTMRKGLTQAYSRGMERLSLGFDATAADGTTAVSNYDFKTYQNLYGGRLPASPRYLLIPRVPTRDPISVRIWFKREPTLPEESPVEVQIPVAWQPGRGIAIPIGGHASDISNGLRLTRFQPPPAASQLAQDWEIVALLGNLAKLLWAIGYEHEELALHFADVASQRNAAAAHGASLDLLGLDLGVPRFPPAPYTWDPSTLALYHFDDVPEPTIRSHSSWTKTWTRWSAGRSRCGSCLHR